MAAAAGPSSAVFVYGTLMAEEVVQVLLGRLPSRIPAVIKGYRRYAITGRQYPAIIPAPGHQVQGNVMFDLTPHEMRVFDLFEDEEYTREEVTALALEGGAHDPLLSGRLPCDTSVYVWSDRLGKELQGEWDYEKWRQAKLADYVKMCESFAEEIREEAEA